MSAAVASPLIQNFRAWNPSILSFPSTSSHQRISPEPQKVFSIGVLFSQIVTRDLSMFYEVELLREVAVLPENLDQGRLVSTRTVVTRLLEDLLREKADKDLGYFLAVTGLKRIGKGEVVNNSGDVFFPVVFNCRMFLPCKGEIMEGVVHHIYRLGVFLRCGPINYVFLSARKMPNFRYVAGENPVFLNDDLAKIEKDVVIRFKVLGVRWIEIRDDIRKEFVMLASLEGDSLGPLTLPGPDGLDL